jgi:hypothetical protein
MVTNQAVGLHEFSDVQIAQHFRFLPAMAIRGYDCGGPPAWLTVTLTCRVLRLRWRQRAHAAHLNSHAAFTYTAPPTDRLWARMSDRSMVEGPRDPQRPRLLAVPPAVQREREKERDIERETYDAAHPAVNPLVQPVQDTFETSGSCS